MATQVERLRIETELINKGLKKGSLEYKKEMARMVDETNKLNSAQKASAKKSAKQGQAFTQLAYALDDLQYGFRGVQNNLQAIAASSGISGKAVLAITGIVIATNYLISNFDKLGGRAFEAGRAIGSALGQNSEAYTSAQLYASILQDAASNTDAVKYATEKLKDAGWDPAKSSLEDFISLQYDSLKVTAAQAALTKVVGDAMAENALLAAGIEAFNEGGDFSFADFALAFDSLKSDPLTFLWETLLGKGSGEIANTIINDNESKITKSMDYIKEYINKLFEGNDGLFDFLMNGKGGSKGSENPLTSVKESLRKINELGKSLGNTTKEIQAEQLNFLASVDMTGWTEKQKAALQHMVTILENYLNQLDGVTVTADKVKDYSQQISNSLTSIISGFAQAVGEGDDIGKALLGGIGNTLVQLGGMLIATGIGVEAFKDALTSLNGPAAIAAGAAMVALGAAFATAANKAGGGSSSATGRSLGAGVAANTTPTQTQGLGGGNRMVGELKLRGQDLVVALQAANEIRNTY